MGLVGSAATGAGIGTAIAPGIGTAIGAGLGAVSNVVSNLFGRSSQKKQFAQEQKMAEYQWNKDVEMWNMANEYNSPTAQMERLKSAGLNPNLVYGNGSVVGNTSTQTPKYQKPNVPNFASTAIQLPNVLEILSQFQDLKMKKEQTQSQAIQNMYLAQTLGLKADSLQYDNARKHFEYGGISGVDGSPSRKDGVNIQFNTKDSPYSKKYSADVQNKALDAAIKSLEYDIYSKMGVGSKAVDQFLRILMLGLRK